MVQIAGRLAGVRPSASMAAAQAAKRLADTGVDVINLGLGEPDFPTPAHITEAALQAARRGETLYTAVAGTAALRAAVADKFRRENGLDYTADEIIVSNGAKQILFNAMMATLDPGDEVILPSPYFVSYPDIVRLFGGVLVVVDCPAATGFRLQPEALEAAITPRTRWLFLNMPGSPSGAVYNAAELQALGEVLARHPQVMVLSDEIYEHIIFDGRAFVSFGKACPDLRDRTLIVNGVSKSYAMTGWRVGYAAGPKPLINAMTMVQGQSVTSVASVCQAAALAALTGPQDFVAESRQAFQRRRDLVVDAVAGIPGLELAPPEGAFYAFIGCRGLIGRQAADGTVLADNTAVVDWLLASAHVAAVSGAAYGLSPFFRISTATSDDLLTAAMARIANAVRGLHRQAAPAVL